MGGCILWVYVSGGWVYFAGGWSTIARAGRDPLGEAPSGGRGVGVERDAEREVAPEDGVAPRAAPGRVRRARPIPPESVCSSQKNILNKPQTIYSTTSDNALNKSLDILNKNLSTLRILCTYAWLL